MLAFWWFRWCVKGNFVWWFSFKLCLQISNAGKCSIVFRSFEVSIDVLCFVIRFDKCSTLNMKMMLINFFSFVCTKRTRCSMSEMFQMFSEVDWSLMIVAWLLLISYLQNEGSVGACHSNLVCESITLNNVWDLLYVFECWCSCNDSFLMFFDVRF